MCSPLLFRPCATGAKTSGRWPSDFCAPIPPPKANPSGALRRGANASASSDLEEVSVKDADGEVRSLNEVESDIIRAALSHYDGRMAEVARRLGIARSTLYRKVGELGIDSGGGATG